MNLSRNKRPFLVLIPIALLGVLSLAVMLLWNNLIPDIFGLPAIHYWQAMGLFLLGRLLFGNFGLGGRGKPRFGPTRLRDRLINMNEEERQKFKEEWQHRTNK